MKQVFTLCIIAILIMGCAPSEEAIQQAISQTQTAVPTPTKISPSQVDLSELIFKDGDLPAGYSPAQVRSELSDSFNRIDLPDNFISQTLSKDGDMGGIVEIIVYEDQNKAVHLFFQSYPTIVGNDAEKSTIGDNSRITTNIFFIETVSMVIQRCNYLINFQFMGTISEDSAIAYGTRLDERLHKAICP